MSQPQRASDIVEENMSQAVIAGVVAAICLILGIVFVLYGALAIAGWLLIAIGVGALIFALVKVIQNKQVPIERVACPYCQFSNQLTAKPTKDFMCRSCQRMVPIENGVILPVYHLKCEHCTHENYFSRRTIKLICEDCGKEVNLDSIRSMIQ